MKKIFLTLSIIVFIAVLIFVVFQNLFNLKKSDKSNKDVTPENNGIQVFMPKPNDLISSPLIITGQVNGNGWTGFEGQVGTVRLFNSDNKELALGILTATTDWMKLPTDFEVKLFFDYPGQGSGQLVFYNENASGEPERNKTFTIPVKLQKSSSAKITVKAYFTYLGLDPVDCDAVDFVERQVPKTEAVAKAALEELLKGLNALEKNAAWGTSINQGVKIQSLVIENGVAKVDFNDELQKEVAGSCKVLAIRAQITQTLKQFPTVKSVIISINGETEGILQP